MFGGQRQAWYDSQGAGTYGNANITGTGTTSTPATVYANTVSSSTYLTFLAPYTSSSFPPGTISYTYPNVYGTFTVTGNVALLDILIVGAGGTGNGGWIGANGGQVNFYSNVIVPPGTYNIGVSAAGGASFSNVNIGTTSIISYDGANGNYPPGSGTYTAQGGTGAGGTYSGGIGGIGLNISSFGTDLTWIASNGNPYFGGGGGGSTWSTPPGYYTGYAGGITGGGSGGTYDGGYSPDEDSVQFGEPNTGGGSGGGEGDYNGGSAPYIGGSGVVIIRHRAS